MAWLEKLFEQIPEIIKQAATSRRGVFALMIIPLSLIGFFFFQDARIEVRVGIFVLMFSGVALFGVQLFRTKQIMQIFSTEHRQPEAGWASKETLKAQSLLAQADQYRLSGRNDQARAAYSEARALFKQVEDRLGEANVLTGLGDLESKLGRNDQARVAHTEARALYKQEQNRLGEANVLRGLGHLESKLGRNDQARVAYTEARALYKHVEDRLGEANVLMGLGSLEAGTNAELAKRHFFQAASLYSAIGMPEWERTALDEAKKLSSQ